MSHPVRILQVVGGMDRAGTETWLMHVLRHIDRRRFQMDFLVNTDAQFAYADEIASLGARLHVCRSQSNLLKYSSHFMRILREQGPYDVVHTHVHYFSGLALRLARAAGVRTRVAHSHTDTRSVDARSSLLRRLYMQASRAWIHGSASRKVAVSSQAAECLFGSGWRSDPSTSIAYCGLDFAAFGVHVDRAAVRREMGFAPDAFVIGHVGRLEPPKNHRLLLRIHAEVLRLRPETRLLMIGTGTLEAAIREMAAQLGIADRVRFAGARPDVARLMLGAMDVFVMPSLWEGLSLASVEAQAAGLPSILSDQIPAEADTQCGLVRYIPVGAPAGTWASEILQHAKSTRISQANALARVNGSRFNIDRSVQLLCALYS